MTKAIVLNNPAAFVQQFLYGEKQFFSGDKNLSLFLLDLTVKKKEKILNIWEKNPLQYCNHLFKLCEHFLACNIVLKYAGFLVHRDYAVTQKIVLLVSLGCLFDYLSIVPLSVCMSLCSVSHKLSCLVLFFSWTQSCKRSSNLSESPMTTRQLKLNLARMGLEDENW